MAHTERCPICRGGGKVKDSFTFYLDKADMRKNLDSTDEIVCHGCGGKGWIEVGDKPDSVVQQDILGKYHLVV